MTHPYRVRPVRSEDLPKLAAIEQKRWEREGTEIMDLKTLTQWYETGSPFFLVAECNGKIDGFYHAIQVHFSLDAIEEHTSLEAQTGHGYSKHTHDPTGNSVYAVNVVVVAPEAGAALNAAVHERIRALQMVYFIGVSRLVHLNRYLKSIEELHGGSLPYEEESIALWYAHESMKMLKTNKTWVQCTPQPHLELPSLRRPDSLLKFHVESINAGLLRIIPNFMKDPKSRNYGAFLASEFSVS